MQKLSTALLVICGSMLLVSVSVQYWSVLKTTEFWLNAGILVGFIGVTVGGIMKFVNANHGKNENEG